MDSGVGDLIYVITIMDVEKSILVNQVTPLHKGHHYIGTKYSCQNIENK